MSGIEDRFVPLGEDLSSIVTHLQGIAARAGEGFSSVRERISAGSLGDLDRRADAAVTNLRGQLGRIRQQLGMLGDVSRSLSRLRWLAADVRRLGAFLLACGCSFAVESARREESRAAFAGFVQELRDLAEQIGDLAAHMNDDSEAAETSLLLARRRIQDDVKGLEQLANTMEGAFSTASHGIQRLLSDIRRVLDRVEQHRLAITAQTGAVIFYLQFGDIVRQKCEHVLAAALEAEGTPAGKTALAVIVRTAAVQLELIQREIAEARSRLSEGYESLDAELVQLCGCGSDLSKAGAGGDEDLWKSLKNRLAELAAIQRKEITLSQSARDTAGEASAAAGALKSGLGSVRAMSSRLHLLALNAIIQTVHLGEHGRTLEELAQHVDRLHRMCETLVPEVLTVLEGIGDRIGAGEIFEVEKGGSFDVNGIEQLEGVQAASQEIMAGILAQAAAGSSLLRGAVLRLKGLSDLETDLARMRAMLEELGARLPAPPAGSATESEFDRRMFERYTMQSERDAHNQVRGLVVAETSDPGIELFSDAPGEARPAAAAPAARESDLGDNVELF